MANETGELWRKWRAAKRIRRQERAAEHTDRIARLKAAGAIEVRTFNDGHHLRLSKGYLVVDFWPASGLWRPASETKTRRGGLSAALRFLGVEEADDDGE